MTLILHIINSTNQNMNCLDVTYTQTFHNYKLLIALMYLIDAFEIVSNFTAISTKDSL